MSNRKKMKRYTLEEIGEGLKKKRFPMEGMTSLGSARFHFREPDNCLGVALHAGSRVRDDLMEVMEVTAGERFREEDPYTDLFIRDFPMQVVALDSRFEYDLNREREYCIYAHDREQWGLRVWKRPLTAEEREVTLIKHREFHQLLDTVIGHILEQHDLGILFDLHSYCYRREREAEWWVDERPEINLGTRSVDREHFARQIDAFLEEISENPVEGHRLRVAENAVFPGGYLTRKYAESHPKNVLVLAIEYKKIFMDERSGELSGEILSLLTGDLVRVKDHIKSLTA